MIFVSNFSGPKGLNENIDFKSWWKSRINQPHFSHIYFNSFRKEIKSLKNGGWTPAIRDFLLLNERWREDSHKGT